MVQYFPSAYIKEVRVLGQRYRIGRLMGLWVPDEGLLFQWMPPDGVVQVSKPKVFPPPKDEAMVEHLWQERVPYSAITAARKYLVEIERIHAQEAVLQNASNRLEAQAIRSQDRFQSAVDRLHRDDAS